MNSLPKLAVAVCRLVAVWLAAALAVGGASGQENATADSARTLLEQAYRASHSARIEDDFSSIIELCRRALASGPSDHDEAYARQLTSWGHNRRGELRADAGRAEEALADFEQAVSLDATRWRAIHNRGVSYAMAGKYDQAEADFNQTIELEPRYANAWFNRGELHFQRGQLQPAIDDYNQALRLKPTDATTLTSRGHAYWALGNFRLAMADLTRAIRLDPQNAPAHVYRAEALAELARFQEALDDYRRALAIDPRFGRAYQGLAWLLATCPDERFRSPRTALQAATRAIELEGDSPQFQYLDTLAACQAAAGDFNRAIEVQTRVLEQAAGQPAEVLQPLVDRLELYQQGRAYVRPALRSEPVRQPAAPDR